MAVKDSNVRRQVTFDKEFYKEALNYAKENNTTLSKLVNKLLEKEIREGGNKDE